MAKVKYTFKTRLIVFYKGKILLLRQTKPNGGNFSLVGGTVEEHEFAHESLIRESFEEAGIILQSEHLRLVHVLHKRMPNEQRITLYFKADSWDGTLRAREPEKFSAAEWHPIDNLPKRVTLSVRQALRHYKVGSMYSEQVKK